jgi:hypothetical protein
MYVLIPASGCCITSAVFSYSLQPTISYYIFTQEMIMIARTAVVLILFCLALPGCRYQRLSDTELFTISEPFERLVVISEVGDITIKGGTGVVVAAEKFARSGSTRDSREYLEQIRVGYTIENNICTITVNLPENLPLSVTGGTNLTIAGIQDMPVDIGVDVGAVICSSINGGTIRNDVGDIAVEEAGGDIDFATGTGSISVKEYSGGNFSLSTGRGGVAMQIGGSGMLDGSIQTSAGDIHCGISKNRSAAVSMQTEVGSISVSGTAFTDYPKSGFFSAEAAFNLGRSEGDVTMQTRTGDIWVDVF